MVARIRHTRRARHVRAISACLGLLVFGGCSTVTPFGRPSAVVDSATTYHNGRATRVFAGQSPTNVIDPVKQAMMGVGVQGIVQLPDGERVILEGKTADNRRATVWVAPQGTGAQVTSRIGLFGDEPLSRALLDRVAIQVGTPNESPIVVGKNKAGTPKVDQDSDVEQAGAEVAVPRLSRGAVSDSTMLRDQMPIGYKDSPIP